MNTKIAEEMDIAGKKAKYDRSVKTFLAHKEILAWILKTCVSEFSSYDIATIMDCIENREVSTGAVHKDTSDAVQIQGMNTEDTSLSEQTIYYDIRFHAIVPHTDNAVQLFINIEAQTNSSPGYPLEKRVIYYLSRMISGQYGTVFTKSHYEKIEKVYSIWFCSNPPQYNRNTIQEMSIAHKAVYGNPKINSDVTDMICGIIVNLGNADEITSNAVLRLMDVLLSEQMETKDKKWILENEFQIAMTETVEGDFTNMCNLSQGIWENGIERGVMLGKAEGSANTVKAFSLILGKQHTVAEIAAECDISEQEVRRYITILNMTPNDVGGIS